MKLSVILFLIILSPSFAFAGFDSPYSPSASAFDAVKGKFVARFDAFTQQLKTTSVFALPTQLAVSGLSGDPGVSLQLGRFGGEYGFNFSTVFGDLPLQILRSLCMSLSSFYGLTRLLRGGG